MPHHDGPSRFFYRHWTSEAGEASLLLLHGFGENSSYFQRLAAELTRNGIDVWAIDHVGHGLSGEGRHEGFFDSVEELAANAAVLLEEIAAAHPSRPLFLLGHSLGGLAAVQLASEFAPRLAGVVISGPPIVGCPAVLPETLIFSLDASYVDNARNDPLALSGAGVEANLWRAVADFLPRMKALAGKIAIPALVIFGEHDVFTTPAEAETWAGSLPDARLWVVPGGYHDILQDVMHREVASEICAFVRGGAADRASAVTPSATAA